VRQVGERPAGLVERVGRGRDPHGDAGRQVEELLAVARVLAVTLRTWRSWNRCCW
jgi:hypothetical protein